MLTNPEIVLSHQPRAVDEGNFGFRAIPNESADLNPSPDSTFDKIVKKIVELGHWTNFL